MAEDGGFMGDPPRLMVYDGISEGDGLGVPTILGNLYMVEMGMKTMGLP